MFNTSHIPIAVFSKSKSMDVAAMLISHSGQNIYFHLNHPVKWVRIVGLVVAFDVYDRVFVLTIDDSSGVNIEVKYDRATPAASGVGDVTDNQARKYEANKTLASDGVLDTSGVTATGRKIRPSGVDIGSVVKIKGGIKAFRAQKQVTLERIGRCFGHLTCP